MVEGPQLPDVTGAGRRAEDDPDAPSSPRLALSRAPSADATRVLLSDTDDARPVHGDNEPFRASADGYRPEAYLPTTADEWTLLALLAHASDEPEGRSDDELRRAAFVLVDRMVIEAQHRLLTGAAEDEDEDEG